MINNERLNKIKNRVTEDIDYEDGEWLLQQVKKLEGAINYVLTAKPEHYHNTKNMLEDFKTVINLTLQGK